MLISYATLTEVKTQWETNNESSATVTDSRMANYARTATEKVNLITRKEFAPYTDTEYIDRRGDEVDNAWRTVDLPRELMSLTSVTLADGTSLVIDTDVRGLPRGHTPILQLQLLKSSTASWSDSSADNDHITIVGEWGHRTYYATEAWQLSGDAVSTDQVTTSATTIKVTDADGTNYIGDTPRFDIGQMIKIDSEFMAVTDTDTTSSPNTITVIRAIRGSTAATHEVAAAISVFVPEPAIKRATQLIAFFDWARRGDKTRATFDGVTTIANIEVPNEVAEILSRYTLLQIGG
jgi:hypothetical protein